MLRLTGSGMVHITKNKFEEIAIPLPPLPEQKKIVEKIEELFSGWTAELLLLKKQKNNCGCIDSRCWRLRFPGGKTSAGIGSGSAVKAQNSKEAEPSVD